MSREVSGVLDIEADHGELVEEGRVGAAEFKDNRGFVRGGNPLEAWQGVPRLIGWALRWASCWIRPRLERECPPLGSAASDPQAERTSMSATSSVTGSLCSRYFSIVSLG